MKRKTIWLVQAAVIACLYVILTELASMLGLANGLIQLRLSESLNVLAVFTSAAVPGVFIGCLLANILTGCVLYDVIFGSLASLIGVIGVYFLRKNRFVALSCPIVANALIVPFILKYAYGLPYGIMYLILMLAIGELVSCGVFGYVLGLFLDKHKKTIFK